MAVSLQYNEIIVTTSVASKGKKGWKTFSSNTLLLEDILFKFVTILEFFKLKYIKMIIADIIKINYVILNIFKVIKIK